MCRVMHRTLGFIYSLGGLTDPQSISHWKGESLIPMTPWAYEGLCPRKLSWCSGENSVQS